MIEALLPCVPRALHRVYIIITQHAASVTRIKSVRVTDITISFAFFIDNAGGPCKLSCDARDILITRRALAPANAPAAH